MKKIFIFSIFTLSSIISFAAELRIESDQLIDPKKFENESISNIIILRNSIFANYGYKFKNRYLNRYFSSLSWYKQNNSFSFNNLSKNDLENVSILMKLEEAKIYEYFKTYKYNVEPKYFLISKTNKILDSNIIKEMRLYIKNNNLNNGENVPKYMEIEYSNEISKNKLDLMIKNNKNSFHYYEVRITPNSNKLFISDHSVDISNGDLEFCSYRVDNNKIIEYNQMIHGTSYGHNWYYQYINDELATITFTMFERGKKTKYTYKFNF